MQPFDRPAVFDEVSGQPFEQVGVSGFLAERAEVAGAADQPTAEVPGPDTVDEHLGSERVRRGHHRFGQPQPAAAFREHLRIGAGQQLQEAARCDGTGLAEIAPQRDRHVLVAGVAENVGRRICGRCRVPERFQLGLFLGQVSLLGVGRLVASLTDLGGQLLHLSVEPLDGSVVVVVGLQLGGGGQRLDDHLRVVEDSGQRVIVLVRDRVELVGVTAGTGNGQSEKSSGESVDAVVERFGAGHGLAVRVAAVGLVGWSDGEEPASGPRLGLLRHQVTGHLLPDEVVEWQVLVETSDHPVTVVPRVGQGGVVEKSSKPVTVASHVQPVPTPALPVVRGIQQPVDQASPSVGAVVFLECPDLRGSRWQADQVECQAADQRAAVGGGCAAQSRGFEPREDKTVDVLPDPVGPLDGGLFRLAQRAVGPVGGFDLLEVVDPLGGSGDRRRLFGRPERPPPDPFDQHSDLGGLQLSGGRHLVGLVTDRPHQQGLVRLARDHRRPRVASLDHRLVAVESQAALEHLGLATVTLETAADQQGTHPLFEELHLLWCERLVGGADRGQREGENGQGDQPQWPGRMKANHMHPLILALPGIRVAVASGPVLAGTPVDVLPQSCHDGRG